MSKPRSKRGHLGRKARRRGTRRSDRKALSLRDRQKAGLTKHKSRNQIRKELYRKLAERNKKVGE
jgi:hypothetical protein